MSIGQSAPGEGLGRRGALAAGTRFRDVTGAALLDAMGASASGGRLSRGHMRTSAATIAATTATPNAAQYSFI
ncbi:MAG TPA: hypothetical protein VFB62_23140 [Polyangiaceae bacterium]|jgi:hypothetical protein|nr:hypothetical protein [Polyangiaceae bacterium]